MPPVRSGSTVVAESAVALPLPPIGSATLWPQKEQNRESEGMLLRQVGHRRSPCTSPCIFGARRITVASSGAACGRALAPPSGNRICGLPDGGGDVAGPFTLAVATPDLIAR